MFYGTRLFLRTEFKPSTEFHVPWAAECAGTTRRKSLFNYFFKLHSALAEVKDFVFQREFQHQFGVCRLCAAVSAADRGGRAVLPLSTTPECCYSEMLLGGRAGGCSLLSAWQKQPLHDQQLSELHSGSALPPHTGCMCLVCFPPWYRAAARWAPGRNSWHPGGISHWYSAGMGVLITSLLQWAALCFMSHHWISRVVSANL